MQEEGIKLVTFENFTCNCMDSSFPEQKFTFERSDAFIDPKHPSMLFPYYTWNLSYSYMHQNNIVAYFLANKLKLQLFIVISEIHSHMLPHVHTDS